MTTQNHWGILVDSEIPVTGVAQNNQIEYLGDELRDAIDLDCESCLADRAKCLDCEHRLSAYCELGDDPNGHCEVCEMCDSSNHDYLIGQWAKDEQGLYAPDEQGEYAAICGTIYTQVVWSKHAKRCALCSPCYPGQGDLDTPGDYLAYDLPPEVYGEGGDPLICPECGSPNVYLTSYCNFPHCVDCGSAIDPNHQECWLPPTVLKREMNGDYLVANELLRAGQEFAQVTE